MSSWTKASKGILDKFPPEVLQEFVSAMNAIESVHSSVDEIREQALAKPGINQTQRSILFVLCDLARVGWKFDMQDEELYVRRPEGEQVSSMRSRLGLLQQQQFTVSSVRNFIKEIEGWRTYRGRQVSIFSLMEDGRELAKRLTLFAEGESKFAIDPYIQVVKSKELCSITGMKLQDIWRYFRYTWSSPQQSVPGRSLQFLVRDRASEMHPVIGIFALSSAAVQSTHRDTFIGWDAKSLFDRFVSNPSFKQVRWIYDLLQQEEDELYVDDFIRDGLYDPGCSLEDLDAMLSNLTEHAQAMREQHFSLQQTGEASDQTLDWKARAEEPLFASKRSLELVSLLKLRRDVDELFSGPRDIRPLKDPDNHKSLLRIIERISRCVRSSKVGVNISELTVCGAVAPYNHLAGGKLVAMLAVSPQSVSELKRHYAGYKSIIASSMAGREIVRESDVVFVGTTSLYGKRPNQYDRIVLPAKVLGRETESCAIRYKLLDISRDGVKTSSTRGQGSFHFTPETVAHLQKYLSQMASGRRVNQIFGEGTSPKLRAIRDALSSLGLNEEVLLTHGMSRCVYGVSLAENLFEYLAGFHSKPRLIASMRSPSQSTKLISEHWLERWANNRFSKGHIRDRILSENKIYPIVHGARVPMQIQEDDLFS
jgi:hypothetical protein